MSLHRNYYIASLPLGGPGWALLFYTELIDGLLLVALAWVEDYRWEVRTVWRIWEVLSLETDSRALWSCATELDFLTACEVSCINLKTWLCGVALESTASLWILNTCSE